MMHVGNGCRRLTVLDLGELHQVSHDALQVGGGGPGVCVFVCGWLACCMTDRLTDRPAPLIDPKNPTTNCTLRRRQQALLSTPECARGLEEAHLARSNVDDDAILALAMTAGLSLRRLDVNGGGACVCGCVVSGWWEM